jgi:hypothetical protein
MKASIVIAALCVTNAVLSFIIDFSAWKEYCAFVCAAFGWGFAASREYLLEKGENK